MTYLYPFPRGAAWKSQRFRSNPGGYNPAGGHTGDDWAMPVGTPLYAPADGIIRNSGWLTDNYADNGWWLTRMGGDTLVIDITDAFRRSDSLPTFIFAHCSDTMAEVGQFVRKGQLVARSGNTGTASTGPHLHVEALPPSWDFNNGVYGRVDPELYFDEYLDEYLGPDGIAAQGTITTPTEDDMTKEQIDALIERLDQLNAAHHVATREHVNGKIPDIATAVWTHQIDHRNAAGELEPDATTPETVLSYMDFNNEQDRNLVKSLRSADPAQIAAAISVALPRDLAEKVVAALGAKLAG